MDGFPIGFRFRPTDAELIFHYLGNKINNQQLPYYGIIHDVALYNYTPDQLTAIFYNYGETEWYFFTSREKKYKNGSRPDRAVGDHGYWKPSGKDQPVYLDYNDMKINIGTKRTLCFFQRKQPDGVKTSWKMLEYIADPLLFPPNQTTRNNCNNNGDDDGMRLDDFVICKIYKSSHAEKKGEGEEKEGYSNNEAFAASSSSQPSPFHMLSTNYGGLFPPLPPTLPSSSSSSQIPNYGGLFPPLPSSSSSQIPHGMTSSANGPTELAPFQSGEEDDLLDLASLWFPDTNSYNDINIEENVNYSGGFENNMVFDGREFHYHQEASSSTTINNPPSIPEPDRSSNFPHPQMLVDYPSSLDPLDDID